MGVTIHYRGSLVDLERVEEFENRVIDLALAIGGDFRLWRSALDHDLSQMVRGLILDLAPGQESTGLLISPEGWLMSIFGLMELDRGETTEKPWCSVKTQFGSIEGHVALVELLTALKAEFVADLEVSDEGEYWEHRDLDRLRHKFAVVGGAIDSLAKTLSEDDLSPEAGEDPEILAARIERLARKVQETMSRMPEHPPVSFPDNEFGRPTNLAEEEARYDALYQENRRRQVAMERSIEEGLLRGEDTHEAFEMAMREVLPPEPEEDVEGNGAPELEVDLGGSESETETREEWRGDEHAEESFDFAPNRVVRHPLQRQAIDLLVQFHDIAQHYEGASSNIGALLYSGGEVMGGLAQALPLPPIYELDDVKAGLALVQLKRALRGTAFVIGAIRLLRDDKVIDEEKFREFSKAVGAIEAEIIELLRAIRHARM